MKSILALQTIVVCWLPKNKEIRLTRNAWFVEINISRLDPYCPHRYFQESKISPGESLCVDAKSCRNRCYGVNMHKEQANKQALILIYKYMQNIYIYVYMYMCVYHTYTYKVPVWSQVRVICRSCDIDLNDGDEMYFRNVLIYFLDCEFCLEPLVKLHKVPWSCLTFRRAVINQIHWPTRCSRSNRDGDSRQTTDSPGVWV
jgi:hypothetical protein